MRLLGYEGTVSLSGEIVGAGKSAWKGMSSGKAENYGYAGSVENYQETLNHALDRAIIDLLNDREFRKAACS
jgi:hypothetical protein